MVEHKVKCEIYHTFGSDDELFETHEIEFERYTKATTGVVMSVDGVPTLIMDEYAFDDFKNAVNKI